MTEREIRDHIALLRDSLEAIGVGSPTLSALGYGAMLELESLLGLHRYSIAEILGNHAGGAQEGIEEMGGTRE